jgi:hypothetical protein
MHKTQQSVNLNYLKWMTERRMYKVIVKMINGETELWDGLTQQQAANVANGYKYVNGVFNIRMI